LNLLFLLIRTSIRELQLVQPSEVQTTGTSHGDYFRLAVLMSRLQKVNFSVWGQANSNSKRCDGCNHLKSLAVRLSPQAVICEFRLFAGDS
jgi:hypothetical protein